MKKVKILFLAANPFNTDQLKLDEEIRAITSKIRASEHRDLLEVQSAWAARPDDLLQSLNEYRPDIIHFSGHGTDSGELILVDEDGTAKTVTANALRSLFNTLKDNVRVVVFNTCYLAVLAKTITQNIDCAIGMNKDIGDQAAIVFAASFYRALGFGRSVQEAFDQGKTALLLEGIPEADTPEILTKSGVNASEIFLLRGNNEFEYQQPIFGRVIMHSSIYMSAVARSNPTQLFKLCARPINLPSFLEFNVTNPNRLDLRINRFFIDTVDFVDVEIQKVTDTGWAGGMPKRKYACNIRPQIGRYTCQQISEGFDYIRLSVGEMEAFEIQIKTFTEGIYYIKLAMEYSIGETTQQMELSDRVYTIGFFDPKKHKVENVLIALERSLNSMESK